MQLMQATLAYELLSETFIETNRSMPCILNMKAEIYTGLNDSLAHDIAKLISQHVPLQDIISQYSQISGALVIKITNIINTIEDIAKLIIQHVYIEDIIAQYPQFSGASIIKFYNMMMMQVDVLNVQQ
jgi:uncharacterized protein with PhoU and TrkA domain